MIDKKTNPVAEFYKDRYSKLTKEKQNQLDEFDKMNPKEHQLRVIKRKRIQPLTGDIFVLSPRENIYFYGLVYNAPIEHLETNSWCNGKCFVFIFNEKTTNIDHNNFKGDFNNLLISPAIVDNNYWSMGYFFNVGKKELSDDDLAIDYGLVKIGIRKDVMVDCCGREIFHKPKIIGMHGISTMIGIASRIEREFIVDPSLLEF